MSKFIITPTTNLSGEICVLGAKNAAIKMIAASCLFDGETILENVPDIIDIQKIIQILEKLGLKFVRRGHRLQINTTKLHSDNLDSGLVGAIRSSVVLVGPLLNRFGVVKLPHPGGCNIGSRPIDLHIMAFEKLGVVVTENNRYYTFKYEPDVHLQPVEINFPKISVTATENVLLFASREERTITINNAAIEPEVIDLINFLKKAGVKISVNDRQIKITGNKNLKNVTYNVIPDRIEAGTYAILAVTTKSELKISNIIPEHLKSLLEIFSKMNIEFEIAKDTLYIKKSDKIRACDIKTAEYPGFPTDLQPPMGVLLTQAQGKSMITENIFNNRLDYLNQLNKMGANTNILTPNNAEIIGPTPLSGAKIESLDLRAGATLLIAALTANSPSEIKHAENIDRGYEKIEERLANIGAKIKRVL